ncbi:adenylate/guanylate cyclase domain-containing protein [soil metagenome]
MRCPACDSDNPDAARFCASCGGRLTATCPHCQAGITPGVRFCSSCGEAVAPGEPAAVANSDDRGDPTGTAERRRVSVLFVDLANFTALAQSMDPEEVRTIQSRYFEVARSVIASFDGTIEKFIGDAVMAVWGAPSTHEDDAERAVRAAMTLVGAVGRLGGAASGRSLQARGAVTTGEAAVSLGAVGQGMVACDLVNIASRLQGRAPRGGVLVDRMTRDRGSRAAVFTPVGSLSLKGRTGRLRAYRATQAPQSHAGRHGGMHAGPFVGRDRELRELVELFNGVIRERRSRLVSVTGIAGMGKSRLAWELYEWVDALPDEVAWHAGRAPAYGEGIAFAAVGEMVRRRIRVSEDAPPEVARRHLASTLDELVRDEGERRWIEPRLAVLLGSDDVAVFDRDELFAAWRRFFERVSERSPTVLVFEDLQWADASLLDFIEYLASWTRDHPIIILALARPELFDRRTAWGAGVGSFTALRLERLPDDAMRTLLAARTPNLPQPLVRQVLERAGGVPLYAVEVARIVEDRRRLARGTPETGQQPVEVPDSLHGLIAARIDALPAAERALLLAAAVLGPRFRLDALVAVVRADAALTRGRIEALVRREQLTIDEDRDSPGYGQLGFVQDLVREVAYGTLARRERRSLHLAAAHHLESLGGDTVAEHLAGHLVEAHRLDPDHRDAARLGRRAVAALRQAAREAIRLHVPERALGLLKDAIRLCEAASPQLTALLEEIAEASRAAGRLELAEAYLRELIALHTASSNHTAATRARARLASVLLSAQRNEPALAELQAAMGSIRHFEADASGVELAAQMARARLLLGDSREGLAWAERALVAANRLGLANIATDVLVTRGTARITLGQEELGLSDLRTAIAHAQETGSLHTELRSRNNLAWTLMADDPRTAMETARHGLELATQMGLGDVAVQLADLACTTAIEAGDWAWALETIAELEERGVSEAYRIVLSTSAATIHALRGDPSPLAALDSLEPIPAGTDRQVVSGLLQARAWCALVAGDFAEVQRLAEQAVEGSIGADQAYPRILATRASLWFGDRAAVAAGLARLDALNQRGRAVVAASMTLHAGLAALDGNPEAEPLYRRAAEAWRTLDLPLPLALCLLDEHRTLRSQAAPTEVIAAIDRLGADGLRVMVETTVTPRGAPPRRARSRPPSARTAPRTGGGRRPPRANDRPSPPG